VSENVFRTVNPLGWSPGLARSAKPCHHLRLWRTLWIGGRMPGLLACIRRPGSRLRSCKPQPERLPCQRSSMKPPCRRADRRSRTARKHARHNQNCPVLAGAANWPVLADFRGRVRLASWISGTTRDGAWIGADGCGYATWSAQVLDPYVDRDAAGGLPARWWRAPYADGTVERTRRQAVGAKLCPN